VAGYNEKRKKAHHMAVEEKLDGLGWIRVEEED
jgi:hypothetical protein